MAGFSNLSFDTSTLAIDAWSSSQQAQKEGTVNAFLKKNSNITLGYGKRHDGLNPLKFTVLNGQDVDVCFKFLVTTDAIDIGPITKPDIYLSNTLLQGAVPTPFTESSDFEWASEIINVTTSKDA